MILLAVFMKRLDFGSDCLLLLKNPLCSMIRIVLRVYANILKIYKPFLFDIIKEVCFSLLFLLLYYLINSATSK